MNIITWKHAYCLHAKATLEDRCSLVCRSEGPRQEIAENKYRSRGWAMTRTLHASGPRGDDPCFPTGLRFLGDKYSWRISLDVSRILPPPLLGSNQRLPTDPIAATSWRLQRPPPGQSLPLLLYVVLRAKFLKHHYLSGDATAITTVLFTVENNGDE